MVEFVGHTRVNRCICLDIDDVTDLVVLQVGREANVAVLTAISGEQVACSRAETVRVRHDGRTGSFTSLSTFSLTTTPALLP